MGRVGVGHRDLPAAVEAFPALSASMPEAHRSAPSALSSAARRAVARAQGEVDGRRRSPAPARRSGPGAFSLRSALPLAIDEQRLGAASRRAVRSRRRRAGRAPPARPDGVAAHDGHGVGARDDRAHRRHGARPAGRPPGRRGRVARQQRPGRAARRTTRRITRAPGSPARGGRRPRDRPHHVDDLAGLGDLVDPVDPGAGQGADGGGRERARSAARPPAGRGSRRRSPCWTARPAPASRSRPSRRAAG